MTPTDGTTVTLIRKKKGTPGRSPGRACLVIIHGRPLGHRLFLEEKDLTIGRSETTQVRIEDQSISRRHARLFKNPAGRWCIKDLKSTNGTFVNGKQVEETVLKDGDLIHIGNTVLKYLSGANIEQRFYEEIYRLTHFDALTQAFNQRFFLRTLEQELNRCRRYRRPLSLAMIDLDRFKKVNDRFGHLAGDEVLKETAGLIRRHTRNTDFFARYGGEEFALIFPETDRNQARLICEKLRKVIESHDYAVGDRPLRLTVSIGLATVEDDTKDWTPGEFIASADAKLYEAKRNGRNRVCD
jgi:diguanylate cyclase (GGDEF)-like protein